MKINVKNAIMFMFILLLVPIVITMDIYHYSFYIKALLSVVYFGLFIFSKPPKKQTLLLLSLFIFNFSFCIPNIISGSFSVPSFFAQFYPFGLYCGILYYLNKRFDEYLHQMRNVGIFVSILFLSNLIFNILTSKAITPILYFNRNGMQFYLLFNIGSILIYNAIKNEKMKLIDKFSLFLSVVGLFVSGSATSAIIAVFILAFMFFNMKRLNIFYCYIGYLIIWFYLIVGQNTDNAILGFIFKTFEKSSTFSNRLWRWQYSLEFIKSNWLWGTPNLMQLVKQKNIFFNNDIFNAHNGILDVFVHGGIFSVISMAYLFIKSAYNNIKHIGTKYYKYIVMVVLAFLICSFTESCLSNNIIVIYNFLLVSIIYQGVHDNAK